MKKGNGISYDLFVGADGANSMMQEAIRNNDAEYYKEHYLGPMCWKALRLRYLIKKERLTPEHSKHFLEQVSKQAVCYQGILKVTQFLLFGIIWSYRIQKEFMMR